MEANVYGNSKQTLVHGELFCSHVKKTFKSFVVTSSDTKWVNMNT